METVILQKRTCSPLYILPAVIYLFYIHSFY